MGDIPINHAFIDEVMGKALSAADSFQRYDQARTDKIVHAVYTAGFNNRIRLAELAHQETRLGVVRDKVMKNIIATRFVYHDLKDQKTAGVIAEDKEKEIVKIAQPIGPIFAVTPITNPTSTVLFKILISLKSRNPIIIRPHGAAKKCSIEAARICYEAALEAGAPENCIQWIKQSSVDETLAFMKHKRTAMILATGSVSLVRAAYSSGNPALGVGPGNVPVFIGTTADFAFAVDQIILSKMFDNGTICASEQSVIVKAQYADKVVRLFKEKKAYFMNDDEMAKVGAVAYNKTQRVMNAAVIGQPACVIAAMAGINIPPDTTVLMAPMTEVGYDHPLSLEILAPILGFYVAPDFEDAIRICRDINSHGGLGHTASIFSNNEERIEYFANAMNAGRILVNTPASFGALGGTYNSLFASLTLACGTYGKNLTTDNITAKHLINIQRIARRKVHECVSCLDKHCLDTGKEADEIDRNCARANNGVCKN